MSLNCETNTINGYEGPLKFCVDKPKVSQLFDIDGFLKDSAWMIAQYEDEFNLTVDEANDDVNRYNYMCLAEDSDNSLIGEPLHIRIF